MRTVLAQKEQLDISLWNKTPSVETLWPQRAQIKNDTLNGNLGSDFF
jgi:hypothetical protein